jgi:metal-responsive CopG/Arc/MetJ family transcriptional regulator
LYIQVVTVGTTRVNFRLPEDLIEKADIAATVAQKNRTEIVTEALREYLNEIEDEEAFKEDVVELYLADEIEFETLQQFVGRQDAESVRASKALLDEGEALAEELAELE